MSVDESAVSDKLGVSADTEETGTVQALDAPLPVVGRERVDVKLADV